MQPVAPFCRRCSRAIPPEPAEQSTPPVAVRIVEKPIVNLKLTFAEIERVVIQSRIENFSGNIRAAARSLGVGKTTLYRKMREYGLTQNGTEIA